MRVLLVALALLLPQEGAQRADRGRFTVLYYPHDARLAQSMLDWATENDTFPGLPRPRRRALIAIAPDRDRFREWIGPSVPEWGAAVAFPEQGRIVMQGRNAGADAGDPREVLRHELAHLALHEGVGGAAPRWLDEGYASFAAHEWRREDALAANLALALGGMPTLEELDVELEGGPTSASRGYALAYRAVSELDALDPRRGLGGFLALLRETGSMERAMRGAYGLTVAGFEQRWRSRTRRRFGALAMVETIALGGGAIAVLLFPLYATRRRRQRARLRAMLAADAAAEAAARESVLEQMLAAEAPATPVVRSDTPGGGEASGSGKNP